MGETLAADCKPQAASAGLLARTDSRLMAIGDSGAHAYYTADGNGNVSTLINTNQILVAKYLYDPFGNVLSGSGRLADANLYRFSSKEFHLIYYLPRYLDSTLQSWLNRDPIGELGGLNLYAFAGNNGVSGIDPEGDDHNIIASASAPVISSAPAYSYQPFQLADSFNLSAPAASPPPAVLRSAGPSPFTYDGILIAGAASDLVLTPVGQEIAWINYNAIITAPGTAIASQSASRLLQSIRCAQAAGTSSELTLADVEAAIARLESRGFLTSEVQSSIDPNQVIRIAQAMQSGIFQNALMDSPVVIDASQAILAGNHRVIAAEITGFNLRINTIPVSVPSVPLSSVPLQAGRVNPAIKTP